MKVASVLNQKGGSGKSTIATNLARALQLRGYRVLLADCDPQGTARDWHLSSDGEAPNCVGTDRPTLEQTLPSFADSYDICVVDGAPAASDLLVSAIKASDLVLIPVQPSPADVWAAEEIVEIIQARREALGRPEAAFIVSRAITGTRLAEELSEALSSFELPIIEGTHQRVAYASALGRGLSVLDLGDEKAAEEVRRITDYVEEVLRL